MNIDEYWGWTALFLLGAYHGINPGMGWLFAVAMGMQEKSQRAVWRTLVPIAAGHGLAIGVVVAAVGLIQWAIPLETLKVAVAIVLFTFGAYRLVRSGHPRWGGMQVGFGHLTIWSFLMATAHGAGLMVLPVLFGMSAEAAGKSLEAQGHHHHAATLSGAGFNTLAVIVHTAGYLVVTGLVAWIVYEKLGLALLRKAWLNLDLVWAIALIATGGFVLLV
jgi:hypothetical protein